MDKMLTKFESKSNRVKGLSFHPVRPWILASLHNGSIQLWDYRMGTCLDKFDEHEGPVRGVDFHKTQPLIVSGGDDYKVKVWDYKLHRCLFTLLGHLDYIRTVQFHVEYPWIVSASDDQTIRIWNWQSRSCISVLTGHNHYVMCAAFHPKEDLIVSASLDQTVRVWDTTGLRKKTVRGSGPPQQIDDNTVVSRVNSELFGGTDALVKYVLEGHERGVNWAAFHPTLPLVVSGADDRQVKLWRMNESKAWEVDTMRGHTNNVSSVLFHPKHELIISNSEDRTIRVWDISKRLGVQTFRRESDRFWILAVHPEQNLLAAGHDAGMTVFKLERERPAYDAFPDRCYYVKDRYLRLHEFNNSKDTTLISLRRAGTTQNVPGIGGGPRNLLYNIFNKAENNVLITSDVEGGSYELLTFSNEIGGGGNNNNPNSGEAQDVRRGSGLSAVFIARDRFAVLDKTRQLLVKNFQNEVIKKSTPPLAGVDGLFFGGTSGRLIMKSDDRIVLFDQQAKKILSELLVPRVKYVVWNKDYSLVALISKHQLVIANKQLEQLCTVNETIRLKGGCWDINKPIFIYTTLNHIKYLLPSGDRGILRGLDVPVYCTRVQGNSLICLDREGKMRNIEIDVTEALFKLALERKDYPEVIRMVKHSNLCGQAIISYLQEKGYPEVALHFVHDAKTRFKLALACGNIQVAMNAAYELGDDAWRQLGMEALRQGNHEVVEMSYQKTKEYEKLSFLYLLTGNTEKLRKMSKIAEMRGDVMSRFHNALFLGDAEERMKVFESTGQISLAYMTAKTHGLETDAQRFHEILLCANVPIPVLDSHAGSAKDSNGNGTNTNGTHAHSASLLQPPTPIFRAENWPLLAVGKSLLADLSDPSATSGVANVGRGSSDEHEGSGEGGGNKWGDDDDDLFSDDEDNDDGDGTTGKKKNKNKGKDEKNGGDGTKTNGKGWADDDDLDISDDEGDNDENNNGGSNTNSPRNTTGGKGSGGFVVPQAGTALAVTWCAESSHAADHFAAGSVQSALQLLNAQIALTKALPLRSAASSLFIGATAFLPGIPLTPPSKCHLVRPTATTSGGNNKSNTGKHGAAAAALTMPSLALKVTTLLEDLREAYKYFAEAQFEDCKEKLDKIIVSIPLVSAPSRVESNDLKELLEVSKEYITAIRVKMAIAVEAVDNPIRGLELAAYFTHCKLQPGHLMLALKTAMATAFKNKNYINAASFSRRLLELPEMNSERNADSRVKAQKVLQKSTKEGRNEFVIDYDEMNPFSLDCANLKPIYKGSPSTKCAYCASTYSLDFKGKTCLTCNICAVGVETVGLVTQGGPGTKHT